MIIALAGRRVDAPGTKRPRFPLQNVDLVRMRIRAMLEAQAKVLVCSAACGADLIALSEAGLLGLRRRIVLPFDRSRFRDTSVTDRPGEWGPIYDQVLDEVETAGDLVLMQRTSEEEAYLAANRAILDEAASLEEQLHYPVSAALVWEGISRGDHDITEDFGVEARKRGLAVVEVKTIRAD
jgi:hypothetical protein